MVWSNWKSMAHRAFGAMRLMEPTLAPTPMSLFLRVLVGIRRPSSRNSRRTRLLLTLQTERRSLLLALRHPQHGRRFATVLHHLRTPKYNQTTTGIESRQ